jgi:hypothetical protein
MQCKINPHVLLIAILLHYRCCYLSVHHTVHQVALVARNEDVENAQLYYEDTLWGDWAPKQEFKVRMSLHTIGIHFVDTS